MEKDRLIDFKNDVFNDSTDINGVISEEQFLENYLPELVESKLIDSEVVENAFYQSKYEGKTLKINSYAINETGERLQLFIVDADSFDPTMDEENLVVDTKSYYDNLFSKTQLFIEKSIKRHIEFQDSDPAGFIIGNLSDSRFLDKIEVIEIFAFSLTVPIDSRSKDFVIKKHDFKKTHYNTKIDVGSGVFEHEIIIINQLITLDKLFLYKTSKLALEPLKVNTLEDFGFELEVLKAADEDSFESYLCILPAEGLAKLYRIYSTRLLERNVRSFLQFRGVNGGMRNTIEKMPERFIAYNNGLTITARESEVEDRDGKLFLKSLTDFQIVNGGQTTASIFFAQKGVGNKKGLDISKINLMAKINVVRDISEEEVDQLISDISLYSNSQTKVTNVDKKVSDPKIAAIKKLSESILTPLGYKWFFEKLKGEFKTMTLLKGWDNKKAAKEYPTERRLTKKDIGKYFVAWGDTPWLVKKGGEKVFSTFLKTISGAEEESDEIQIDRIFFEELVAKTILFRNMAKIHGERKKAIGQLRAAVVPYSISIIYKLFGGTLKREAKFDFSKIWKEQSLSESFSEYCKELMLLMYQLIHKYKLSDDVSENTKKQELWQLIKDSKEIKVFLKSHNSLKIKEEYWQDQKRKSQKMPDFTALIELANFLELGREKINYLFNQFQDELNDKAKRKIPKYLGRIFPKDNKYNDINDEGIFMIKELVTIASNKAPSMVVVDSEIEKPELKSAIDNLIRLFNESVTEDKDIKTLFLAHRVMAEKKGQKYTTNIKIIGDRLSNGGPLFLSEIASVSGYFSSLYN